MLTIKEINDKIENEILVDAYHESEVSMGWYYYLEETLEFPFKATALLKTTNGQIKKEEVIITGLASEEEDFTGRDFNLLMQFGRYTLPIAYSQLSNLKATSETLEALAIWDYWVNN